MIKGLNHSEEGVKTTHNVKEESVHQYSPNDSSNAETEEDERCDKKNGASGRGVTSIVRVRRHCQTPDTYGDTQDCQNLWRERKIYSGTSDNGHYKLFTSCYYCPYISTSKEGITSE